MTITIDIFKVVIYLIAILFGAGIIYTIYLLKKVLRQYDEGLEVNLIAHRMGEDIFDR